MEPMTWSRIRSAFDVMVWLEHGFLPNIWGTVAGKVIRRPGLILNRNLVVGGVRARQRRANLDSANCNLLDTLEAWYTIQCRSSRPASDAFGPLATSNLTIIDQIPAGARQAFASQGDFYDAHFDVERPLKDALETATYLRRHDWLTASTTSLELETLMLNGESGSFAILQISFQWLYDGAVTKRVRSHVFRAVPGQLAIMDYLPEICWLGMILILLNQELWEVLRMTFKRELRLSAVRYDSFGLAMSDLIASACTSEERTCPVSGTWWTGSPLEPPAYDFLLSLWEKCMYAVHLTLCMP